MPDDRQRKSRLQFGEKEQVEPAVKKPGRKLTRALAQQDSALTRSRLQLTEAEFGDPKLEKPLYQANKAADKLEKAKSRIPKQKALAIARATDEATGKTKIKLRFDEKAKPPSRLVHEVLSSPTGEAHYEHGRARRYGRRKVYPHVTRGTPLPLPEVRHYPPSEL